MLEETKKSKKLAVISFILSLSPIGLLIIYFIFHGFFINAPIIVTYIYNLIVQYIPIVSLILSIISLVLVFKKKASGFWFATVGIIISIVLGAMFFTITANVRG